MGRRRTPPTKEGWFVLHDLRSIDWDALRSRSDRERDQVIREGTGYLESVEAVEDADEGESVAFGVLGHKADLLLLHLRPTLESLDALERQLDVTALGEVTHQTHSYLSVTEVSGYSEQTRAVLEDKEIDDRGLERYVNSRLYPSIPDGAYVSFYPMSKRRDPEYNWYDLPFEERAAHIGRHGEIGREYAGSVTQIISGSVGFDDWEWGVTLFTKDPIQFKRLLYEMRFDQSTSLFAEFGSFYTGYRVSPRQLEHYLAGESVSRLDSAETESREASKQRNESPFGGDAGIKQELEELGVYGGEPHGGEVYALVLYYEAAPSELSEAVGGLRGNFDHYDTHVKTAVYADKNSDRLAVVSIWETDRAAQTAAGFLSDLPGHVGKAETGDGFGTIGMFYTVKPEYRDEFIQTFDEVSELLGEMDGHRETALLVNREDENDMFIASEWESKSDALEFFRNDTFRETVTWGRDVLTSQPRHVFLT